MLAHRAATIVLRDMGEPERSVWHADRAVMWARQTPDSTVLAEALLTRALTTVMGGRGEQALADADTAVTIVRGDDHAEARARAQRALVRMRAGGPGWREDFDVALPVLERLSDTFWRCLVHMNRGVGLLLAGDLEAARTDLERAATLYAHEGNVEVAALATHNLGLVASRAGNLPAALRAYDAAAADLRRAGLAMGPAIINRAETLAAAGLLKEARTLLGEELATLGREQPALQPEAHLLLARMLLAEGELADAAVHARAAVRLFEEQARPGWQLLAGGVAAVIGLTDESTEPTATIALADELARSGWPEVADEVRAAAALRSAAAGDRATAGKLLGQLAPKVLSVAAQLDVARARMVLARQQGEFTSALATAADGLDRLTAQRVLLGASELRAHVTRLASALLEDAVHIALETRDAALALDWVDRARAQALDHPPVVPPDDHALAADLGRLRVLMDDLTRRRASGEPVGPLEIERTTLEQRIRDRARTASGTSRAAPTEQWRPPGTTEVAYLEVDGRLVALVADDHGVRQVDLHVARSRVEAELDAVGFAMQRVGSARQPGRRQEVAARSLRHSLDALDAALVAPLDLGAADRVVVSPADALFEVPWSGLAGLVHRAVAVAPALRLARRAGRDADGTGTLLVEGPRLAHARAELDALATVAPSPRPLLADDATVDAVRAALHEVAVAHLACHGVFRDDNPQFSSLELADGPMFVYDLESVVRVPDLIVLSACQTGRSSVHAGGELLGVTASLLALGARTVVAALADVPDDLSALLMLAFHQHLAAGARPAEALARARATLLTSRPEPAALLTAAAFSCLGAP